MWNGVDAWDMTVKELQGIKFISFSDWVTGSVKHFLRTLNGSDIDFDAGDDASVTHAKYSSDQNIILMLLKRRRGSALVIPHLFSVSQHI